MSKLKIYQNNILFPNRSILPECFCKSVFLWFVQKSGFFYFIYCSLFNAHLNIIIETYILTCEKFKCNCLKKFKREEENKLTFVVSLSLFLLFIENIAVQFLPS